MTTDWKVFLWYGTHPVDKIMVKHWSDALTEAAVLLEIAEWLNDEESARYQPLGDMLINRDAIIYVTVMKGHG